MKGTFFRFSYLSVWKRTIKKSSYIKKHCSSLGILCQLIMHTSWLSEQSKNILNICFIEIKTYISLKALWVQETKSLKRTSDVPWSENLLFFFLFWNYYNDDIARWSADSSLEATKSSHGFGNLTRFRFRMDLYTSFAHGRGISAWKDSHLPHHFGPGVPWWLRGT